jgi:alpha-1,3-rhamnosyltransferase
MTINSPKVSVLVPSYNHELYVEKCIQSLLAQTYKNLEIIVLDDGSTDSSPDILRRLSIENSFHFEHQKNRGLPRTLNKMIRIATGKYIALVASDDVYHPDKIKTMVEYFEELPDRAAVVFGNAAFIDSKDAEIELTQNLKHFGDVVSYFLSPRAELNIDQLEVNYKTILGGNFIPALSTLIKREALIKVGLFEESINLEDWSMWLKIARNQAFYFLNTRVAYYRVHDSNASITNKDGLAADVIQILEREKQYCFDNHLISEWRVRYFGSISYLFRSKAYLKFMSKILKNNIVRYLVFVSQRKLQKYV